MRRTRRVTLRPARRFTGLGDSSYYVPWDALAEVAAMVQRADAKAEAEPGDALRRAREAYLESKQESEEE